MGKGDTEALLMAGVKGVSPELSDLSGLRAVVVWQLSQIWNWGDTGGRLLLLSGVPYLVESVMKPKYIRVQVREGGGVILNVIFNWKINTKWHRPRLKFMHITSILYSMLSKLLLVKLSGEQSLIGFGWCVLPVSRRHKYQSPKWTLSCPFLKVDKWSYLTSVFWIVTAHDG